MKTLQQRQEESRRYVVKRLRDLGLERDRSRQEDERAGLAIAGAFFVGCVLGAVFVLVIFGCFGAAR
jgi:hypothetical protein